MLVPALRQVLPLVPGHLPCDCPICPRFSMRLPACRALAACLARGLQLIPLSPYVMRSSYPPVTRTPLYCPQLDRLPSEIGSQLRAAASTAVLACLVAGAPGGEAALRDVVFPLCRDAGAQGPLVEELEVRMRGHLSVLPH